MSWKARCATVTPTVEWADPVTGEPYSEALVIHNAFDCREVIEQAEEILKKLNHETLHRPTV